MHLNRIVFCFSCVFIQQSRKQNTPLKNNNKKRKEKKWKIPIQTRIQENGL